MSLADELLNDLISSDEEDVKEELRDISEEPFDEEADAANAMVLDDDEDSKDGIKRRIPQSHGTEDDLSMIIIKEIGDVKKLARLITSETMDSVLRRIDEYGTTPVAANALRIGNVEDDPEYRLVVEANALSAELDQEIILVNKFIRDHYRPKFPELETLIMNPLDYAKTVKVLGNEMIITKMDLTQVLPPASIMVVKTATTTTRGHPLDQKEITLVLKACDMALDLDAAKRKILDYVQSRMSIFAPNLSAFIGTQTASKLIGATGGLNGLAKTPSCNLATLGAKRALHTGFALTHAEGAQGWLYQSELIQRIAHDYRRQAQRKVSAKIVLLARIDVQRESPDGSAGTKMRQDIDKALRKLQIPPEHRGPRALPAPLEPISKKRGGKRVRRMKDQNAMTEMRKLQNRMKFGEAEEEVGFGDETEGLGMLTQSGSFRALKVDNRTKARVGKKMQARLGQISGIKTNMSGKETSGLQSSLSFTPYQGIELVNPSLNDAARKEVVKAANERWFGGGTFSQIKKPGGMMLPPPLPKK
jgi:U4/U6 small nuclear ribonucleoprotein PRP31